MPRQSELDYRHDYRDEDPAPEAREKLTEAIALHSYPDPKITKERGHLMVMETNSEAMQEAAHALDWHGYPWMAEDTKKLGEEFGREGWHNRPDTEYLMVRTKELLDWLDEGELPANPEESLRYFGGTKLYGDADPPYLYFLERGEGQEPGLKEISGFAKALQSKINGKAEENR